MSISIKAAVRNMFEAIGLNPELAQSYCETVEAEMRNHLVQYSRDCLDNAIENKEVVGQLGGWFEEENATYYALDTDTYNCD